MIARFTRIRSVPAWGALAAVGTGLIALYFTFPAASLVQANYYSAISLGFTLCLFLGVWWHKPADKLTWWMFGAASLLWIAGDTASTFWLSRGQEPPFPSFCDALYLAGYPFLLVAVARLGQGGRGYRRRERRLDSLIVTMGLLVLTWDPLLAAYASDTTMSTAGKLTLIAYPIMDVAVLYMVLSAILFAGRRGAVDVIIALSMVLMLAGDLAYDVLEQYSSYANGDLIDVTWLGYYLLLGVAALHPSMARAAVAPPPSTPRSWWLVMVAVAGFVPPGYLVIGTASGLRVSVEAVAWLCLIMVGLAALRMAWMFQGLRQQAASLRKALRERDQLADDLRHQAFHDPLTGLPNRALLNERIEQALARCAREDTRIALVMCDIDGFKTVNDTLGHHVGDALLVAASARLAGVIRPGDTVARLGGDEFAALLVGVPQLKVARGIADRIVAALREPVEVGGELVAVSGSVGISLGTAAMTADELLREADAAMYEAKTRGKNRFVLFESGMQSRVTERLKLTAAFAGALERCEFYLDYQPSFSLVDGHLEGFEALVRWRHPTLGTVAPLRFIPLAEETGFILPLGRWILNAACRQAVLWPAGADGSPTVAVNISVSQLSDRRFASDVRAALDRSGLPGDRLVLEVTESMLIGDKAEALRALRRIKQMGVRIAIDDFGTGYSSLSQLRELPVDLVKIDKSFIDQLTGPAEASNPLIEAILRLAKSLDLTTIAEGIEVAAQQEILVDMGCDSGQGFLLSRPLDGNAATALAMRTIEVAGV